MYTYHIVEYTLYKYTLYIYDSFNIASRDEDKILDQIYMKQICPDFYYDDFFIFITLYENA